MVEKKKESKKTDAKKNRVVNTPVKAAVQEDVYPAISLANDFGLSDFAFYMIKEAKGINDGSLLTMKEFRNYYKEIIEGR